MKRRAVYLLDADPDLADALGPEAAAEVRRYVVAAVEDVETGTWRPDYRGHAERGDLGLLVLDGLAIREVHVGNRTAAELLGAGDVLRPWDRHDELRAVPADVTWTVVAPLRLAVLDARFALVAARRPALLGAVLARAIQRSRTLAFNLALTQITGLETRLHVLLLEMAQRWGHVTPDGIRLELELTHEALARLAGARRPSVTTALGRLEADGRLRREGGAWILPADPPDLESGG